MTGAGLVFSTAMQGFISLQLIPVGYLMTGTGKVGEHNANWGTGEVSMREGGGNNVRLNDETGA